VHAVASEPFRPWPGEVRRCCLINLHGSCHVVSLVLRSGGLSSARVTGLHRYYTPIRHLPGPPASLAGRVLIVRLPCRAIISTDFPRSVGILCHACCHHYPGGTPGSVSLCLPETAAVPVIVAGRLPRRRFEACTVFTLHCGPNGSLIPRRDLFWEYFSSFVTSCSRSQCFWLERCRQPGLSPGEPQRLVEAYTITSPRTPSGRSPWGGETTSLAAHTRRRSGRR